MSERAKFEIFSVIVLGLLMALFQARVLRGQSATPARRIHQKAPGELSHAASFKEYRTGLALLHRQRPDSATYYLKISVNNHPNYIPAYANLGRAYIDMKQYDNAKQILSHALTLDSLNSDLWEVYGRLMQSQHQYKYAISAYNSAIASQDYNPYSRNNLALIYINQHQYRKAITLLTEAIQQKNDVPFFFNNLGYAYEQLSEFNKATQAYKNALNLQQTYTKAQQNLNRVQQHLQNVSSTYADKSS